MDINEIYNVIEKSLEMPVSYFTNAEKRTFYIYLVSSTLLAYFVYSRSKKKTSFLKYLFPKHIWLSQSAFVDVLLIIFNSFIKVLLIGPYLVFGLYISFYTSEYLVESFGMLTNGLGEIETLILYTVALTIIGDFATFIVHYAMHKIPFLWEFHKVHHSAEKLNPLTQYRIHPIELLINNAKGILVFGFTTGIFDYLSNYQVDKIMFLGVNIFGFFFMFLGANLRHSHVELKYPTEIEKFLISPFQHQIHHSNNPVHFDKNMGSKFAIWDWMFGTLVLSKSTKSLKFGLGADERNFRGFWQNLLNPFKNILIQVGSLFGIKKQN